MPSNASSMGMSFHTKPACTNACCNVDKEQHRATVSTAFSTANGTSLSSSSSRRRSSAKRGHSNAMQSWPHSKFDTAVNAFMPYTSNSCAMRCVRGGAPVDTGVR